MPRISNMDIRVSKCNRSTPSIKGDYAAPQLEIPTLQEALIADYGQDEGIQLGVATTDHTRICNDHDPSTVYMTAIGVDLDFRKYFKDETPEEYAIYYLPLKDKVLEFISELPQQPYMIYSTRKGIRVVYAFSDPIPIPEWKPKATTVHHWFNESPLQEELSDSITKFYDPMTYQPTRIFYPYKSSKKEETIRRDELPYAFCEITELYEGGDILDSKVITKGSYSATSKLTKYSIEGNTNLKLSDHVQQVILNNFIQDEDREILLLEKTFVDPLSPDWDLPDELGSLSRYIRPRMIAFPEEEDELLEFILAMAHTQDKGGGKDEGEFIDYCKDMYMRFASSDDVRRKEQVDEQNSMKGTFGIEETSIADICRKEVKRNDAKRVQKAPLVSSPSISKKIREIELPYLPETNHPIDYVKALASLYTNKEGIKTLVYRNSEFYQYEGVKFTKLHRPIEEFVADIILRYDKLWQEELNELLRGDEDVEEELKKHNKRRPKVEPAYHKTLISNMVTPSVFGVANSAECAIEPFNVTTGKNLNKAIAFNNGKILLLEDFLNSNERDYFKRLEENTIDSTPEIFNTFCLPFSLEITQGPTDTLDNYLTSTQEKEQDREFILNMMGLIIAKEFKYNVGFIIKGASGSGKSVILDIIKTIVGEENICNLEPHKLHLKFTNVGLSTNSLNMVEEINTDPVPQEAVSNFKLLTEGKEIQFEEKNKQPITITTSCHQLYSGNYYPNMKDSSGAANRRFRFLSINKVFYDTKDQDMSIREKIRLELPSIFHKIMQSYVKLHDQNVKVYPFSSMHEEEERSQQKANSHVARFVLEAFETTKDGFISNKDIKEVYSKWRDSEDIDDSKKYTAAKVKEAIEQSFKGVNLTAKKRHTRGVSGVSMSLIGESLLPNMKKELMGVD